jgi:zinc transport system substrate-binding protein
MPAFMKQRKTWVAAVLTVLALLSGGAGALAVEREPTPHAPVIVTSIPPVHSLTAMVMAGVGQPRLLLDKGASPHDYALKPSDARALARAKLVIWIGPGLEGFLTKPLQTLARRADRLSLLGVPGLNLRRARRGGVWQSGGDDGPGDEGHGHTGGAIDPHIWLDPRNGVTMLLAIARALSRVDPANKTRYAANAGYAVAKLIALERTLARRLWPIKTVPYIVFHDAYGYFEGRFGLRAIGAVAVAPGRRPGIRRIRSIRARIRQSGVVCLFTEPQFAPAIATTLTEGTGARTGILDPIGMALSPGARLYPMLLTNLTDQLVKCLVPAGAPSVKSEPR